MGFEFYWPWMAVLLILPLLVQFLWSRSDPEQAETLALNATGYLMMVVKLDGRRNILPNL